MASRLKKSFGGSRHLICGRTANITQPKPEQNRVNCQYRNKCWLGCPFGAYFSTQSSTLPVAMKTGNLTVRPFSIVTQVLYDKDKKRARGVEVHDGQEGSHRVDALLRPVPVLISALARLGAGSGGYACALRAAQLSLRAEQLDDRDQLRRGGCAGAAVRLGSPRRAGAVPSPGRWCNARATCS